MGIRLRNDWVYYALFQFIWVIAVLPKMLQLVCLAGLLCLLLFKSGKEKPLDGLSVLMLVYLMIYGASIVANLLTGEHEISRVFAAVNTWSITLVALGFYHCYRNVQLDWMYLSKCMFGNVMILLFIYALYEILGFRGNFSFMPHALAEGDWMNDAATMRLTGYLEYANLILYMMLFCYGLSLPYVMRRFGRLALVLYEVICILPVFATNSRMGMILMPVVTVVALLATNWSLLVAAYRKNRTLVWVGGCLLVAAAAVLLNEQLAKIMEKILGARQGSTDTRFGIYLESITRMLTESPIIGCGIKDMLGYYPYGSHSTYIGAFYKTGIVGGLVFMAIIGIVAWKTVSRKTWGYTDAVLLATFLCLLAFSAFEDLDGANWCIVMFLSVYAVSTVNGNFTKQIQGIESGRGSI